MILELCTDSFEGVLMAGKYAAKRVELCAALSIGGLTPSHALTSQCARLNGPEVHVMLRHREGNFVYNENELSILLSDMESLSQTGINGVVFGCLNTSDQLDIPANKKLITQAHQLGLTATFHRAFDCVENPEDVLRQMIDLGFNRLLTSGLQATAIKGIAMISKLVELANGNIEIMAGSGVNTDNALALAKTGIDALHFSSHRDLPEPHMPGMGSKFITDEEKIAGISRLFS